MTEPAAKQPVQDGVIFGGVLPRHITAPDVAQREASDPRHSVWVNASAGSGKTTVLTKRVTRLLLSGVSPHKILCLTFTRAAAAEMSLRVAQQLGFWAVCDEATLERQLEALEGTPPSRPQREKARRLFAEMLSCPGGMRIRTIHAFCQEILGRFPIESGVAPQATLIEEDEAQALRQQEMNRLLTGQHDPALQSALGLLLDELGEKGLQAALAAMRKEARRVQAALAKQGGPAALIAALRHNLDLRPQDTEEAVLRAALADDALPADSLRAVLPYLLDSSMTYKRRGEALTAWLTLDAQGRVAAYDAYRRLFLTGKNEPFKDFASKDVVRAHPEIHDIMAREAARIKTIDATLEALRLADITAALIALHTAIQDAYDKAKAARGVVDYDDLITHTLTLLRREQIGGWVMYKLDGGIDHMLVDEAQDTSRAQWDIVRLLSEEFFAGSGAERQSGRPRTLFVVGDEKQSIYSFQNADPDAFEDMRAYFADKLRACGQSLREVDLRVSFRSAPAVLRLVDEVFAPDAVRRGVSRDPVGHQAALPQPGHAAKMGRVEYWPLQTLDVAADGTGEDSAEGDDAEGYGAEGDGTSGGNQNLWAAVRHNEEATDAQATLAQKIAETIKGWLTSPAPHPQLGRRVRPDDVMILLRTRGDFADLMVRALKKCDVPVTGVDRMRLIRQLPVMDLLALIQFILLPDDDLTLACLLRSPLLGVSEDDLMRLALPERQSLWQALQERTAAEQGGAAIWQAVHAYLAHWLSRGDYMTPLGLLTDVLSLPCPGSAISGRHALWQRLGIDALDPIDELLNAAQHYVRQDAPNLQGFIEWLTASDSEIKRELDTGGGQVRIMTVHAAKGLEAPIVFLPDTTGLPDSNRMPKLAWSADGVPCYIPRAPVGGLPAFYWQAMMARQMEEYRRLLYVALTRAAHHIILCGWENKKTKTGDHWFALTKAALQKLAGDQAFVDGVATIADQDRGAGDATTAVLPDWARQSLPPETHAATMRPSEALDETSAMDYAASPDGAYARGRITHQLLQYLPDLPPENRRAAAAHYLAGARHRLSPEEQNLITDEVLRLFDDPLIAPLFGPDSRAEIPVAGHVGSRPVSGQIDRLCVTPDAVLIIDYKTNRPPPPDEARIPPAYRAQMAAYAALIRQIYPDKSVRCFLLWTYTASLMEVGI